MFTSKTDKLIYVVGIYTVLSFSRKVAIKIVKKLTKELENAHTKAEAKTASDELDDLLADLSEEEKATINNEMANLWKFIMNVEPPVKKTED